MNTEQLKMFIIGIVVSVTIITLGIVTYSIIEQNTISVASKAGLQQCFDNHRVLWKKECK